MSRNVRATRRDVRAVSRGSVRKRAGERVRFGRNVCGPQVAGSRTRPMDYPSKVDGYERFGLATG
jgi:hypothetical protein